MNAERLHTRTARVRFVPLKSIPRGMELPSRHNPSTSTITPPTFSVDPTDVHVKPPPRCSFLWCATHPPPRISLCPMWSIFSIRY